MSSFVWFSDLADVAMIPKTNMIYLWSRQTTPNDSRKILRSLMKDDMFGNIKLSEIEHSEKLWKRRVPNNPEDLSNISWKNLDMEQYLSRKMK